MLPELISSVFQPSQTRFAFWVCGTCHTVAPAGPICGIPEGSVTALEGLSHSTTPEGSR